MTETLMGFRIVVSDAVPADKLFVLPREALSWTPEQIKQGVNERKIVVARLAPTPSPDPQRIG